MIAKIGKISALEGEKYRIVIEDMDKIVTLPLPRIKNKLKIELSAGEQSLTKEHEKFKVGESVLVVFTTNNLSDGIIIGALDG